MPTSKIQCFHAQMNPLEKLFCISNALDFLGQAIATSTDSDMYLDQQGRDGLANLLAILGNEIGGLACDLDSMGKNGGRHE